jgi:hypothetical protein
MMGPRSPILPKKRVGEVGDSDEERDISFSGSIRDHIARVLYLLVRS